MTVFRSLATVFGVAILILFAGRAPQAQAAKSVSLVPSFKLRHRYTQVVTTLLSQSILVDGDSEEKREEFPQLLGVCVREIEIVARDENGLPTQVRVKHVFQSEFICQSLGKGFVRERLDKAA